MRIFKNKLFDRWARNLLTDESLLDAANKIAAGNYDASLGQKIFKQRVATGSRGKSGGTRTIVAFQQGNNVFFMYGFSKGERANISKIEKEALQEAAKVYLAFSSRDLTREIKAKRLIEVKQKV